MKKIIGMSVLSVLTIVAACGKGASEAPIDPATDSIVTSVLDGSSWKVDYNNCSTRTGEVKKGNVVPSFKDGIVRLNVTFDSASSSDLGCVATVLLKANNYGRAFVNEVEGRFGTGDLTVSCVGDCADRCKPIEKQNMRILFAKPTNGKVHVNASDIDASKLTFLLNENGNTQGVYCQMELYR